MFYENDLTGLYILVPVSQLVEGLEGVAFLEEAVTEGWDLRFQKPRSFPVSCLKISGKM